MNCALARTQTGLLLYFDEKAKAEIDKHGGQVELIEASKSTDGYKLALRIHKSARSYKMHANPNSSKWPWRICWSKAPSPMPYFGLFPVNGTLVGKDLELEVPSADKLPAVIKRHLSGVRKMSKQFEHTVQITIDLMGQQRQFKVPEREAFELALNLTEKGFKST